MWENEESLSRFYNLDFLKFLFALVIINHHLFFLTGMFVDFVHVSPLIATMRSYAAKGYMGVEFFFILSGVWLQRTLKRSPNSINSFVWKKFMRLWPLLFFSIFCFWCASLFDLVAFEKYSNILNLLFLQNSGLTLDFGNNASAWFVSSLFWSCLFYYILHSVLSERGFFLTVSLIAYFAFVLMVHGNNGSFNAHLKPTFYSLLNFGMLRAIAEIGLGLGVGHVYDILSKHFLSPIKKEKMIFGIIETVLFIFVFRNVAFHYFKYQNDLLMTLSIAALILVFMLKKSYLSNFLNHRFLGKLGAVSYAIYIMQEVCFIFFRKGIEFFYSDLSNLPDIAMMGIYILCIIITVSVGIICYAFVEKPIRLFLEKIAKDTHSVF